MAFGGKWTPLPKKWSSNLELAIWLLIPHCILWRTPEKLPTAGISWCQRHGTLSTHTPKCLHQQAPTLKWNPHGPAFRGQERCCGIVHIQAAVEHKAEDPAWHLDFEENKFYADIVLKHPCHPWQVTLHGSYTAAWSESHAGTWLLGDVVNSEEGEFGGAWICCILPQNHKAPVRSQSAGTEAMQRKGQLPHQNFPYHFIGLSFLIIWVRPKSQMSILD